MTLGSLLKQPTGPCMLRATGAGVETIDILPVEQTEGFRLYLSHNSISSLKNITQFRHLRVLLMEYNNLERIEDLRPLGGLNALTELFLEGNPVCSLPLWEIHVISMCAKLRELNRTHVVDVYGRKYSKRELLHYLVLEQQYHEGFVNCKFVLRVLRMRLRSRSVEWATACRAVATELFRDPDFQANFAHGVRIKSSGNVTVESYFSFMRQKLIVKHRKILDLLLRLGMKRQSASEFKRMTENLAMSMSHDEFVNVLDTARDLSLGEIGIDGEYAGRAAEERSRARELWYRRRVARGDQPERDDSEMDDAEMPRNTLLEVLLKEADELNRSMELSDESEHRDAGGQRYDSGSRTGGGQKGRGSVNGNSVDSARSRGSSTGKVRVDTSRKGRWTRPDPEAENHGPRTFDWKGKGGAAVKGSKGQGSTVGRNVEDADLKAGRKAKVSVTDRKNVSFGDDGGRGTKRYESVNGLDGNDQEYANMKGIYDGEEEDWERNNVCGVVSDDGLATKEEESDDVDRERVNSRRGARSGSRDHGWTVPEPEERSHAVLGDKGKRVDESVDAHSSGLSDGELVGENGQARQDNADEKQSADWMIECEDSLGDEADPEEAVSEQSGGHIVADQEPSDERVSSRRDEEVMKAISDDQEGITLNGLVGSSFDSDGGVDPSSRSRGERSMNRSDMDFLRDECRANASSSSSDEDRVPAAGSDRKLYVSFDAALCSSYQLLHTADDATFDASRAESDMSGTAVPILGIANQPGDASASSVSDFEDQKRPCRRIGLASKLLASESVDVGSDEALDTSEDLAIGSRVVLTSLSQGQLRGPLRSADDLRFDASRGESMSDTMFMHGNDLQSMETISSDFENTGPSGLCEPRGGPPQVKDGLQPSGDGQHSSKDGSQPSGDGQRSSKDGSQPSGDGQRSSKGGQHSSNDGSQPSGDGQRSSKGGQRLSQDRSQPSGADQHANESGSRPAKDKVRGIAEELRADMEDLPSSLFLAGSLTDIATAFSYWKLSFRKRRGCSSIPISRVTILKQDLVKVKSTSTTRRLQAMHMRGTTTQKNRLSELTERHELMRQIDRQRSLNKTLRDRLRQLRRENDTAATFASVSSVSSRFLTDTHRQRPY